VKRYIGTVTAALLCMCAVGADPAVSPAAASDSWEFNGHRYELVHTPMTWADAITYCAGQSGNLLTVNSQEEQESVNSHNGNGWLYGTDEGSEGAWRWLTGEPFTYLNWGPGSPDNGGPWGVSTGNPENLLFSRSNGEWDDQRDWIGPSRVPLEYPFTCEYPLTADLSLRMDASPVPATAGERLTYTLTVRNDGPSAASDVQVVDTLPGTPRTPRAGGPPTVTLVSSNADQGTCTGDRVTVRCAVGTLDPGAGATITLVVNPALFVAGNQLSNSARATTTTTDPVSSNDRASTRTLVSTCTVSALSGVSWAQENGKGYWVPPRIGDLRGNATSGFEGDVTRFIAAMRGAGISVTPKAVLRTLQRAYLMHYSWRIAQVPFSRYYQTPNHVPDFVPTGSLAPVNICWAHRDPRTGVLDLRASRAAAAQMVKGFGTDTTLKVPPALTSNHTAGLAVDMATTWAGKRVCIPDANGGSSHCSRNGDGTNRWLIAWGKTFRVIHYLAVDNDRRHWSINGR
jgi:uncharacterized repeat protein (TIGR01451 family)